MNQKKAEETTKQTNNNSKPKTPASKKPSPSRHPKKKVTKNTHPPYKKYSGVKKPSKKPEQAITSTKKEEDTEFMVKDPVEKEWIIDQIDRYIMAVRKAFEKIPEHEKEEIDLREIWINSSLPADLILKIITEHGEQMGIKANTVYLDGKIVF